MYRVFDGHNIGGGALDDAQGWDFHQFAPGAFAGHEGRKKGGGFGAQALGVRLDAAQGRIAETAQDVVVVHA
jgi:hypothetical protein